MDDRLVKYLSLYRATASDDAPALEREVWDAYGVERAVLSLDMSGFSRLTERHGILHFLAMIQHMREVTRPLVEAAGGEVVKYEADNMFAVAATVDQALDAALGIVSGSKEANRSLDEPSRIHVCLGIDFGRLLLIPGAELFGAPVNFACKLGEDMAGRGEILITDEAFGRLAGACPHPARPARFTIGGLEVAARIIRP